MDSQEINRQGPKVAVPCARALGSQSLRRTLALSTVLLAVPACRLCADGGYFHRPVQAQAGVGYSADQRCIVVYDRFSGMETMVLETKYEGRPGDYAWVIPVPNLPGRSDVTVWGQGALAFDDLFNLTEPRAVLRESGVGCAGCGAGGGGAGGGGATLAGVNVVDRLSVRGVDISLLSANDSRNLNSWLNDNNYRFPPEADPVLQHYITKHWFFLAAKVEVPVGSGASGDAKPLEPLKFAFRTDKIVFPLRISSVSSGPIAREVLLYVFSTARVRADNFPTVAMSLPAQEYNSAEEFRAAYQEAFLRTVRQPEGPALVVEYAKEVPPDRLSGTIVGTLLAPGQQWYLTRLRTFLSSTDMKDDIVFARDLGDVAVELTASIEDPLVKRARRTALAFVLAVGLLHVVRQRNGRSVRDALVAVAAAAFLLL